MLTSKLYGLVMLVMLISKSISHVNVRNVQLLNKVVILYRVHIQGIPITVYYVFHKLFFDLLNGND